MKERPIIFSGEMVRAILDGRKTQTRRVVKDAPPDWMGYTIQRVVLGVAIWIVKDSSHNYAHLESDCPYGKVGDRLWVREAFAPYYFDGMGAAYRADWSNTSLDVVHEPKWKPSIHMPRALSRITLEITDVRVERLQGISEDDAKAEGVQERSHTCGGFGYYESGGETWECECMGWNHSPHVMEFVDLWNFINGKKHPWAENPWVWVLGFEVVK